MIKGIPLVLQAPSGPFQVVGPFLEVPYLDQVRSNYHKEGVRMEVPWEAGLSYLVGVLSFLVALGTPVLAVHGIVGDLPEKEDLCNE